jgi:uncharacterized protein
MTAQTQESRSVVDAWYTALAAGDMEGVLGGLAEDVVVNVLGSSPVSGRHVGRDAFVAAAVGPIFAALEPETIRFAQRWEIFAADGERVVALMHGDARCKNGRRYDNSYCHLFTIRDGKIVELYEFLDTALVETAIFGKDLADPGVKSVA